MAFKITQVFWQGAHHKYLGSDGTQEMLIEDTDGNGNLEIQKDTISINGQDSFKKYQSEAQKLVKNFRKDILPPLVKNVANTLASKVVVEEGKIPLSVLTPLCGPSGQPSMKLLKTPAWEARVMDSNGDAKVDVLDYKTPNQRVAISGHFDKVQRQYSSCLFIDTSRKGVLDILQGLDVYYNIRFDDQMGAMMFDPFSVMKEDGDLDFDKLYEAYKATQKK